MDKKKSFLSICHRPEIGSVTLSIVVALYLVVLMNRTFWSKMFSHFHYDPVVISILWVMVLALFMAMTVSVSVKYLTKPLFILLILIASIASWFSDQFGIVVDSEMVRTVLETTTAEARNFVNPAFILYILVTGVLPSALIAVVRIRHRNWWPKVACNLAVIVPLLLVAVVAGLSVSRQLISTMRQHANTARLLNPVSPMFNAIKYALANAGRQPVVVQPLGLDATVHTVAHAGQKPRVLIVVAGETARAANFWLGGYERQTNPELARRQVLYFSKTTSCGTATSLSIPCMFSVYPRTEYSHKKGRATETLPDVLSHAGIYTEWWDNNTGSKGVADRIKTVDFYGGTSPEFCDKGECLDGIMLEKVGPWLDQVQRDSVLFIHQIGSHGPAYYKRYTEAFRQFRPDCRGTEFSACTLEEIRNAYDNSLLYTDDFLSQLIDALSARADRLETALIYMSDHGESLGENGIFLHGAPYMFAPPEQKHIPFVLWMAPDFATSARINQACLQKNQTSVPYSHDNLFPSVLTMMNVETSAKDPHLDMFAPCKYSSLVRRKGDTSKASAIPGGLAP